MDGLLPGAGDPSHRGMVENLPSSFSPDKPEEAGRWYFSRKEIEESSPSRRDGIDLKKETYLRKSYCTFLQDLGMRLKVPQVTIASAIIFCHRFFLRQSHAKNDRRTIATVCMFLAGKVEETPRPLKDVILVSYEIIHKKDPAAIQKIKQKEVYEQQKELILLGERVVLATLGFDLNVLHPYKPLVEAIKKFRVAQNALAQVAWNFVNDGLRTSLCLQFKPHHIAAGAIFLAAKFLKVKLPSDGEKVWWQEFDVTPRQLEEVSNQMLELYEQNRLPPSQSEVDGSAGAGVHQPMGKAPNDNEESVPANDHAAGGASSVKPGVAMPSSTRPMSEQSHADNQSGSQRSTQNRSNDNGSTEMRTLMSEHKVDIETKDQQHPEKEPLPCNRENLGETLNRPKLGLDQHVDEDQERNSGRRETMDAGEGKKDGVAYKTGSDGTGGQNLDYREDQERNSGRRETMDAGEGKKDGVAYKTGSDGTGGQNLDYREDQERNSGRRETMDAGEGKKDGVAYKTGSDGTGGQNLDYKEDQERNSGRRETMDAGEGKKDGVAHKTGSDGTGGQNLDYREGPVSQSPQDAIKKIDKDKLKAAVEKRRKSRVDVARKVDLMDEDDLIERELEEGIELAAEDEKIKRERRQGGTTPSSRQELKNQESGRDHNTTSDGNHSEPKEQPSLGPEAKNVEEGEASLFDDGDQEGFGSPKSGSRKRKTVSPDNNHLEGRQQSNYSASGYHQNHQDSMEDGNRIERLGYVEREHKRQIQENQA